MQLSGQIAKYADWHPVRSYGAESYVEPRVKSLLDVMPDLIKSFLDSQDIKPISKTAYRKGMERFLDWMKASRIHEPDKNTVRRFRDYLFRELGLAANTVNLCLVAVKRFFAYLEGSIIYPDIAKGIKGVRQPKGHLREALTASQVRDLLDNIDVSTVQGKRNHAIINLMARTGLRTIEIVRANVEDIRQNGEALLFVQGKGRDSKDEFVLLTDAALKPIRRYLRARGSSSQKDPLFASLSDRNRGDRITTKTIREMIKRYLRQINIDTPRLSAHSLRHFFATAALKAGSPLLQVKESMRHASIETTQRYLHNLDRIENAAERYVDF